MPQPHPPDGPLGRHGASTPYCQHNAEFFANPDYEAILMQQEWEITEREIQAALQQEAEAGAEVIE